MSVSLSVLKMIAKAKKNGSTKKKKLISKYLPHSVMNIS